MINISERIDHQLQIAKIIRVLIAIETNDTSEFLNKPGNTFNGAIQVQNTASWTNIVDRILKDSTDPLTQVQSQQPEPKYYTRNSETHPYNQSKDYSLWELVPKNQKRWLQR